MIEAKDQPEQPLNPYIDPKNKLFLLTDSKSYTFTTPFQKILSYTPMFNSTCLILAIKSHRLQCLSHISSEGKTIKQLLYPDANLSPFVVISDREALWFDADQGVLRQWNLETGGLVEVGFLGLGEGVSDAREVFLFPETGMFCVAEWGNSKSNILRLSYFQYPLHPQSQPFHIYESTQTWTYEHTLRRGNTHSLLLWFKSSQRQTIQLKTFQFIEEDNKLTPLYSHHCVTNPIRHGGTENFVEISVGNVWELGTGTGKFFFVTITDRHKENGQYPNSLFVYETKQKLFRQSHIKLPPEYRLHYCDYFSFGKTSLLKTFSLINKKPTPSPIFYLNNALQQICASQTWTVSHLNKYTFPGYDGNMVVDAEYENGNVGGLVSRAVRVVERGEIWVLWLAELVGEGVSEDLLESVVGMLG